MAPYWKLRVKAALIWTVLFYGLFWTHPLVWLFLGLGSVGAWFHVLYVTWRVLTTPRLPGPRQVGAPRVTRRVIFEEELPHE